MTIALNCSRFQAFHRAFEQRAEKCDSAKTLWLGVGVRTVIPYVDDQWFGFAKCELAFPQHHAYELRQ